VPSAAKFWEAEGLFILAELVEPGQTINQCCSLSAQAPSCISPSCITLAPTPLASHRKQLQKWGGKFFHTHPTIGPDLEPSSRHIFGYVKDQLLGRFETRETIQKAVHQSSWMAGTNFTEGEFSNSQNAARNVAIMWKNKQRSVD
jgi:hypothetical protein